MHEFDLHFTKPLVIRAVNRFWLRLLGIPIIVIFVFSLAGLIYAIVNGHRSWLIGSIGAILVFVLLILVAIYVKQYRDSVKKFRNLDEEKAHFAFNDFNFIIESAMGRVDMKWSVVQKVWIFPEFWLLFVGPSQFFTLTTADISEDMQQELKALFETHKIGFT